MKTLLNSPTALALALGATAGLFLASGLLGCKRGPARDMRPGAPAMEEPTLAPEAAPKPEATETKADSSRDITAGAAPKLNVAPQETPQPITRPEPMTPRAIAVSPDLELPDDAVHSAPKRAAGDLTVLEASAARDVIKRKPIEPDTQFFADGESVWAWVRVKNPGARSHIWMLWKRGDAVRSRVRLRVGTSPGWRTWSRHRMRGARDIGEWVVEVRTEQDELLHTLRFNVEADAMASAEEHDEE